jgi:chaperone required for assembly of F1-ATPase
VKRFWKEVALADEGIGWSIELDGRPVKTPARALLVAPVKELADAIANEWRAIEGKVDPRAMPFTGLANAAIDRVAPDKEAFAAKLARYAEADLACYRADAPPKLLERQNYSWDPLLGWARRRYDVDFNTTLGLLHVAQPPATVERLSHAVAALDAFQLAGFSPLVTIGGSLVTALAVLEHAIAPDEGWNAVSLDERWQLEHWGADAEAETMLHNRRCDFLAAAHFLELLDPSAAAQPGRGRK